MLLQDDDEIYDVDGTYLGPPGKYIGRLRYRMLAVCPLMILLGLAFLMRTGIGFNLFSVAITVMVAIRLTQWIVDKTDQERPIGVLVKVFKHEVSARRAPTTGSRSRPTRAFRQRTTKIGDAHPLPTRAATASDELEGPPGALDGSVPRRRWRTYQNQAAASRKGIKA